MATDLAHISDQTVAIYVVDDDHSHERQIQELGGSLGLDVRHCDSIAEFVESHDQSQPACVVTNLSKLRLDGSLKDSIAEDQASHLAIVISGHDVQRVWKVLGCNGIRRLEKPCQAEALTHAIRRSLEADTGHCERHARLQQVESRLKNLSDRERQILDLIMAGKPNKAIAGALHVSKRTVESGRREVHQKMHADSLAELVLMVAEVEFAGDAPALARYSKHSEDS